MSSDLNGLIGLKYHSNLGRLYYTVSAKYFKRYNEIIEVNSVHIVQNQVEFLTICDDK